MALNWDAIGAIGEVVGAFAVFISLLYLAIQIRNSRRSDQIVAAAGAASAVDEWIGQVVRDKELHDLYRRGLTDYESLSKSEKGPFSMLMVQFFRCTEAIWLQLRMGVIETNYWSGIESTLKWIVGSAGGSRCLDKNSEFLSPEFVSVVQKLRDEADSTEATNHDDDAGNGGSVESSSQPS